MTIAWTGKYIEAVVDGRWEYARRVRDTSAAVILAITDSGEVVLVEQHRVPLGRRSIELPAGLIGDELACEAAAVAARRELEEETGFNAATLTDLGEYASSPGMTLETFHFFLATGLVRAGPGGGVDGEDIAIHVVPLDEIWGWLDAKRMDGLAIDCRLVALLPWAKLL